MTDLEFLAYVGTDATKWAEEFCKIARDFEIRVDEDWMVTWFANAIEQGRREGAAEYGDVAVGELAGEAS